jgi:glycine oxidase
MRPCSDENYTSYHAAAMLAPFSETAFADPMLFSLSKDSVSRWDRWLKEIAKDSGQHIALNRRGSIVTAHPADESDFCQFKSYLRAKINTVEPLTWQVLDEEAIADIEPGLKHFQRAVYLPGEACMDNRALLSALRLAIQSCGGSWYWNAPVRSVRSGKIIFDKSQEHFDLACDCRGVGAIGEYRGLRAVCGEIIRVRSLEVKLSRPVRILHPRYALYVVPHPDQIYAVGATEIESDRNGPITVRSCLELLSALFAVHPAFAEAEILESTSASRPAFVDNLPGKFFQNRLLRLNGFYRHGYLLAPRMVETAIRDLENRQLRVAALA